MGKARAKAVVQLAILLAFSTCAFALDPSLDVSQYAHTAWKIREGFIKGTIFSVAQTADGFLWLGTEFGLVRFDGVQAIPWLPPVGEHLPSNWINGLLVARDGTLWIATEKGLASWKDDKLTSFPEAAGHVVTSLLQDSEETIWFGVRDPGRLCAVRVAKTQCYGAGSFGWSVRELYEDHKGNLWVSAQTGLWRWAPGPLEHYRLPGGPVEAKALIEGDDGALLIATGISGPLAGPVTGLIEGLKQLTGGEIRDYTLPGNTGQFRPTCLFRSSDGSLWIGTAQGLLHLHQGRIDRFSAADGLSANFIRDIFEDREGNVWVSTESGLDRFREFAAPTISVNQGLSTSAVYVLEATPDGNIWIDTADGLNRWQNGHVTVYGERSVPGKNRPTDERELAMSANVTKIADSGLQGIFQSLGQDDQGRLWAGSSEGVFCFDRGRFVKVPGVPSGNILSIAGDEHGKVWISNLDQGLFYAAPEGAVQRITWARFGHKYASALLPDRLHGGLWLGFFDGGIAYLRDGQVRASHSAADGLGNGSVNDLQPASDGAVWAATEGGLSWVKEGVVTTLTSRNGLPCDAVNSVIEDNDHSFWLYMACGMVRIARSELDAWVSDSKRRVETTVFDSSDGVRVRALAGGHGRLVTKSPDGKIWFSTPDGVGFIDPRHLPFNKLPPPVYVEQITADGKKYDASPRLRLPPHVRDLAIDYTALSLVSPEKVRFRFKLEGQDKKWREVINERRVEYSNLPPGNYRFRVIASNNSGVWNNEGASLDFEIVPAYYQTNWFRALCAAVALALVFALYRVRIRQLQQRQRILREVIDTIPAMAFMVLPDGTRQFFNQRWAEYTGISGEQAAGLGWRAALHPEDLNRVIETWRMSMAAGEPIEYEVRFRRGGDGEYRWFQVRGVPLRDEQGKIIRWYGVVTDIEDLKRAEESLHRSEGYLIEAQRLSHIGNFVYNPRIAKTLYWSEEIFRIFGLDPQPQPPTFEETRRLVHPDDLDRVSKECRKAFADKVEFNQEYRLMLRDGTVKHLHAIWRPVFDKDGEVLEYIGTAAEVTDRKRAEEEREKLRQAEAELAHINRVSMMGELAASLAHEIKQPMAAAQTNAEACLRTLERGQPDLSDARDAASGMIRCLTRAVEIIDRVRALFSKGAPHRDQIDVNELVREIAILLNDETTRHSVTTHLELAEDIPRVVGDRIQLQQVLLNLMLNGIEAMSDNTGELRITSQQVDRGQVLISVSDTGRGLPSDKVDQIFNAFVTTKPQGTGMGLAISRSIIESHGGRLWAAPNSGAGATFHFILPIDLQESV